MRYLVRHAATFAAVAALAAAAGACAPSSLGELPSINLLPRPSEVTRPDWLTYSGGREQFELRPVTAADLVNADGQCAPSAEGAPAPEPGPDGSPQPPVQSGGIALQMTECEVVRRAGAPGQLQVGADERGERATVMTYAQGPRPGIYRFRAGRLSSIERGPEPAPSTKAAPKAKSSKKAARS
jgi:hypothetical protein